MKKGISLIALLTTVAIIIILVTAVSVSGAKTLNDSKKIQFASEIAYIQELVNSYKAKNGNYPISDEYTFSTLNVEPSALTEQFKDETLNENNIKLYKVSTELIGANELKYGNLKIPEDVYLLSKDTGRVYYANSVLIDKKYYYTLTDDLKKIINYTAVNDEVNANAVVFEYPNTEWTNVPLNLNIKIPASYINVNVNIAKETGNASVSSTKTENNYNIYEIRNMQENYIVHVSYKENDSVQTVQVKTFSVSNFDKIAPTYKVSNVKTVIDPSTSKQYRYIDISEINDNLSGVKSIKYENNKIEDGNVLGYFTDKGIEVKNNIITVNDGVSTITFFIVDKAGNYKYQYIEL